MSLKISSDWLQTALDEKAIAVVIEEKADKIIQAITRALINKINEELSDVDFANKYINSKVKLPEKKSKAEAVYAKLYTATYKKAKSKQDVMTVIVAMRSLSDHGGKEKEFLDSFIIPEVNPVLEIIEKNHPRALEKSPI